ncbi:hypothetical protein EsCd1HHP024_02997 [Escherichia sp. HH091_1A]|nr:hypothetical protein EsCd1HHP024_02997 [Escherichia sp. HH091_1A]
MPDNLSFPSGLSVDNAYKFARASCHQAVCKTQEASNEETTFGEERELKSPA